MYHLGPIINLIFELLSTERERERERMEFLTQYSWTQDRYLVHRERQDGISHSK
jgi:hypothetical protein